jgi:hypothetical protein
MIIRKGQPAPTSRLGPRRQRLATRLLFIASGLIALGFVLVDALQLRGADLVIAFVIGAGAISLFVLLLFADVESLRRMDIADTRWDRTGRFRGGRRSARPKHKQK